MTVDFGNGITSTAHTSYGFGGGLGIEFPLDRQRCREGRTPPRLQLGTTLFGMNTTEGPVMRSDGGSTNGGYGAFGLTAGIEFPL
jgi:hypothetical protein